MQIVTKSNIIRASTKPTVSQNKVRIGNEEQVISEVKSGLVCKVRKLTSDGQKTFEFPDL